MQCQQSLPDPKWTWSDRHKAKWEEEIDDINSYQKFYEHWYKSPTDPNPLDTFPYDSTFLEKCPYELSLPPLPFRSTGEPGQRILITKTHEEMFRSLLYLRQKGKGRQRGAVLTGEHGIGVSL